MLALSLQLLSQLHHSLPLNLIVGLHPLLAPACYETAWDSTDTKAGWGSGDGAITSLWVHPKTATMLQGRDEMSIIGRYSFKLEIAVQCYAPFSAGQLYPHLSER